MPNIQQFGDDSRTHIRPVYCYQITQLDSPGIAAIHITGHADDVVIEGKPGAAPQQVFAPATVSHGPIRREGNFDKSTFALSALTRDIGAISRYCLTGAVPRIKVEIIKINPGILTGGSVALWGQDTRLVQTGIISSFSFAGFGIKIECVHEALFSEQEIPRWRFSKTCNHQLFSSACGASTAGRTGSYVVTGVAIAQQILIVAGAWANGFLKGGVLLHNETGVKIPIFENTTDGTSTFLTLGQWVPEFSAGDVVTVSAGCNHTFTHCRDKFNNSPNFGGFSEVPNKNPSSHGA